MNNKPYVNELTRLLLRTMPDSIVLPAVLILANIIIEAKKDPRLLDDLPDDINRLIPELMVGLIKELTERRSAKDMNDRIERLAPSDKELKDALTEAEALIAKAKS